MYILIYYPICFALCFIIIFYLYILIIIIITIIIFFCIVLFIGHFKQSKETFSQQEQNIKKKYVHNLNKI